MQLWAVCFKQTVTVQHMVGDQPADGNDLLQAATAEDYSTDMNMLQTCDLAAVEIPQLTNAQQLENDDMEHVQDVNSDASARSFANEILCLTSDVGEVVDERDKANSKCAGSSAEVPRSKHTVTRLFSDRKLQPSNIVESKSTSGSRTNDTSKTAIKTESASSAKMVASPSNATTRQSLRSRGSFDLSSLRSSTTLSSRTTNKPVDVSTRRPSVPKQTTKQHAVTGGSKQQRQAQRKSSTASSSSLDQKTTSESSLAAGDFSGDLPAATSLRSSTPVTTSQGDSNDPSSVSRVSSVSDASSLTASHGSNGAFSASVFQSPKPSTSTGKPRHHLLLFYTVLCSVFIIITRIVPICRTMLDFLHQSLF